MRDQGVDDSVAEFWRVWVNALRSTQPKLLAYLSYMVERLLWMKVVLKPTGSVYLHCDPTASHYIKVMMDGVFDQNFRNELIWKRTGSHGGARRWGPVHDSILFYTASNRYTWNRQFQQFAPGYLDKYYRHKDERGRYQLVALTGAGIIRDGTSGQSWRGINPTDSGRHWAVPRKALSRAFPNRGGLDDLTTQEKLDLLDRAGLLYWSKRGAAPRYKRYTDETPVIPIQDMISDIPPINSQARERLGYSTQKPLALLDRIIKASSNPGDVVFDPFCGCGTTLESAHRLGRRWIGVDVAIHAVKRVAAIRLRDRLGLEKGRDFIIEGVPHNLEGAKDLWDRDKYHFQKWAVEQVDGFVTSKRTADGGIDGRLYFAMPTEHGLGGRGDLESMAIEVKGGKNVSIEAVRALRGVLDSDAAVMAGLIVMEPLGPTKQRNFHKFMADAGDLDILGMQYPKMQMLTVPEILEGKGFDTPGVAGRGLAQQKILSPF